MTKGKNYLRTDLALEQKDGHAAVDLPEGVRFREERREGVGISRLTVENEDAARLLGKPVGEYVTLSFKRPWLLGEEERTALADVLKEELSAMLAPYLAGEEAAEEAAGEKNREDGRCLLAAGLGNRRMTADAIGPAVIDKITVTRHISRLDPALFKSLSHRSVAAVAPGVLGDTGIESAENVKAIVGLLRPSCVLVIDALAARDVSRLSSTIQLCNTGISPGSGVGNDRPSFDRRSLGVPVVALGVPMIVDSSTLVCDALGRAGIDLDSLPDALGEVLENGRSFFVSLKDADAAVEALASILAEGIDGAMRKNSSD